MKTLILIAVSIICIAEFQVMVTASAIDTGIETIRKLYHMIFKVQDLKEGGADFIRTYLKFMTEAKKEISQIKFPGAVFSLGDSLLELAETRIVELGQTIGKVIKTCQKMLHDYAIESVNYAAVVHNNSQQEILDINGMIDKACREAEATLESPDANILSCLTQKKDDLKAITVDLPAGISKCILAPISKFMDVGIDMGDLGIESLGHLHEVNKAYVKCTGPSPWVFAEISCLATSAGSKSVVGAQLAVSMANKALQGATLLQSFKDELLMCVKAKVSAVKQQALELPVSLSVCKGKMIVNALG